MAFAGLARRQEHEEHDNPAEAAVGSLRAVRVLLTTLLSIACSVLWVGPRCLRPDATYYRLLLPRSKCLDQRLLATRPRLSAR